MTVRSFTARWWPLVTVTVVVSPIVAGVVLARPGAGERRRTPIPPTTHTRKGLVSAFSNDFDAAYAALAQMSDDSTYIDVEWFGADGSDELDDSDAIQQAITAIAGTGGTLLFPPGTYVLNRMVDPEGGYTMLALVPDSVTIKQADGGNIHGGIFNDTGSSSDLCLMGLRFDGNYLHQTNVVTNCFVFDSAGVTNIWVEDCTFENFSGRALRFAHGSKKDIIVIRCSFVDCGYAVESEGSSSNIHVLENYVEGDTFINIFYFNDLDGPGDGVYILNNTCADATPTCYSIRVDGATRGHGYRGVEVSENIVTSDPANYTDPISGGSGDNISLVGVSGFVISKNIVLRSGDMGISVGQGSRCGVVCENHVERCDASGINLANGCSRTIVSGNTCINNGQDYHNRGYNCNAAVGLHVHGCNYSLFVRNTCYDDQPRKTQYAGMGFTGDYGTNDYLAIAFNDFVGNRSGTIGNWAAAGPHSRYDESLRAAHPFADGDTTPSVCNGVFFATANTQPTHISGFDDPNEGEVIWVTATDSNTIFEFASADLKGNDGENLVTSPSDVFCFAYKEPCWHGTHIGGGLDSSMDYWIDALPNP